MENRVIIVGAGPVGLMLAGEIRLGGADVVVYDKLPAPSGESRALGFTKRVAEIFDQRGLLSRLGTIRWGQNGHFGGVGIDLSALAENHRGVLGLPQSRTEELLTEWITGLGVTIRRGYAATRLTEDPDHVTVHFDGPEGAFEDTAAYVVGCDGGGSTIRTAAGIKAPGWEATRGMFMADITGAEVGQRPTGQRIPGGNMILSVSLGDGYYRILIHDKSLPPRLERPLTYEDVADAWQRMTGESLHHAQARWICHFDNAAGLATHYRKDRVLLAGDAAHHTPPLAGWGLSAGIQDAANLGWKLAAVLGGRAPETLLDSYHAERHPIGQQLLRDTHAASTLYLTGDELEPLRATLRELLAYPDAAHHLAGHVSGLTVRYDMETGQEQPHPLLGCRIDPGTEFTLEDGTRTRIAELLLDGRPLHLTAPGSASAQPLPDGWADRVTAVSATHTPGEGSSAAPLPETLLIRPDGYLAWAPPATGATDGQADAEGLGRALTRWFGPAAVTA
ncbi:FAD-dependent monooxygenase [Streptomyces physcomitrii]|uniref:FAD-dependent monooxygenase n=1 Tax=Streptomyces physcomitrii TaxID=2724184 RepID=UPI0033DF6C7E